MKKYIYEKYVYTFLEKEKTPITLKFENKEHPLYGKELDDVLKEFIGCVNNDITRARVKNIIQMWANINNYIVDVRELEIK